MGNRFAPKARRTPWFAYIAAMWALAFALMSFYWAAGGTLGANTLATGIANLSEKRDFWFVAILWLTGALKLLGTFIAVKLAHPPFPLLPYRLSRLAAWLGGSFMILYGGANLTVRAIMAVRLLGTPDSMHSTAARWHLLLWDPWWLLGGLLFVSSAWAAPHRPDTNVA